MLLLWCFLFGALQNQSTFMFDMWKTVTRIFFKKTNLLCFTEEIAVCHTALETNLEDL